MSLEFEKYFDIDAELSAFKVPKAKSFRTRAIHVAQEPEQWKSRATVPPIHTSSTYQLENQNDYKYFYLRVASPSRDVLQRCFADLDEAKHCFVFPSGNAATACLFQLLKPGDHLLLGKHLYGGSYSLAMNVFGEKEIEVDVADFINLDELGKAIKPNTKIVYFESPSNPGLRVIDIKAVTDLIHSIRSDIIVAIDNTYLTPYFQRPLTLGVDVVMYSFSKYVNGHTDIVMGALTFNDDKLHQKLRMLQIRLGMMPSPYDCHMVQRSLRTLAIRMDAHFRNSIIVAKFLEQHPAVKEVYHPALKSHPDHEVAVKQAAGHNGMISFWLKQKSIKKNEEVLKKLKMFVVSGSLGGVESSVNTPMILTASVQPKECREDIGVTDNLVRLSVGIEDPEDLIEDLNQALNTIL